MATDGDYDLCICDLHLPKLNGFQLVTQLGDVENHMQIVFTDSLPDDLYEQVKEQTHYQCIRKPFDLAQFREIIDRALERVKSL